MPCSEDSWERCERDRGAPINVRGLPAALVGLSIISTVAYLVALSSAVSSSVPGSPPPPLTSVVAASGGMLSLISALLALSVRQDRSLLPLAVGLALVEGAAVLAGTVAAYTSYAEKYGIIMSAPAPIYVLPNGTKVVTEPNVTVTGDGPVITVEVEWPGPIEVPGAGVAVGRTSFRWLFGFPAVFTVFGGSAPGESVEVSASAAYVVLLVEGRCGPRNLGNVTVVHAGVKIPPNGSAPCLGEDSGEPPVVELERCTYEACILKLVKGRVTEAFVDGRPVSPRPLGDGKVAVPPGRTIIVEGSTFTVNVTARIVEAGEGWLVLEVSSNVPIMAMVGGSLVPIVEGTKRYNVTVGEKCPVFKPLVGELC